jgi:pyruvate ferredoxin oxidoreductase beta subunit
VHHCPPGWGFPENLTVKVARVAVQTGFYILYEIIKGKIEPTVKIPRRKSIGEYTNLQRRFSHLTEKGLAELQKWVDERCGEFSL